MYKFLRPVAVAVLAAFSSQAMGAVLLFQQRSPVLAITEFTSTGTNSNAGSLAKEIPESVSTQLTQDGRLTVIPEDQVTRAEEETMAGQTDAQDIQAAVQLGRKVGARAVLTGNFSAIGSMVKVDARLIDVSNGSLVYEKSHYMLNGSAISDLANEIAGDVEEQLVGAPPESSPKVSQPEPAAASGPPQPLPPEPVSAVTAASTGFQWWYWVLIGAGVAGGVYAAHALIQSSGSNSTVSIDFPLP